MKVAFLGAGKMGSALVRGMVASKFCAAADLTVSDPWPGGPEALAASEGVAIAASNAEAVEASELAVLCVKPNDARSALESASSALRGKLLISIAAGVPSSSLAEAAPGCRVIRAMPNTAAFVGKSMTALAAGPGATSEDLDLATALFESVGTVVKVDEPLMDAVTGVSGSGPAFIYLVMEAMSDGAVAAGLPRTLARELVVRTLAGAAEMALASSEHPAVLREMVTSPGGTTIAGLMVLEHAGVRHAFADAVQKAAARAAELSSR